MKWGRWMDGRMVGVIVISFYMEGRKVEEESTV